MSPMLSRIYGTPGGTEALDVLMKYMYGFSHSISISIVCPPLPRVPPFIVARPPTATPTLTKGPKHSYKGMAHAAPQTNSKSTLTPQATGFSQVHARGGGEGGGQAMSVLLSWHEKVRFLFLYLSYGVAWRGTFSFNSSSRLQSSALTHACRRSKRLFFPSCVHKLTQHQQQQLVEVAGPGSIVRVMADRRTV
jgi:hypothetical protein